MRERLPFVREKGEYADILEILKNMTQCSVGFCLFLTEHLKKWEIACREFDSVKGIMQKLKTKNANNQMQTGFDSSYF